MDDTSQESYQRRREQVRKAQRTHRERKANYVKSLENEVSELRKQSAQYLNEVKHHQNTISRLKEILTSHGISIPSDFNQAPASDNLATISLAGRPFQHQELHAQISPVDAPIHRYDETESSRTSASPHCISESSKSSVEPEGTVAPSVPPKLSAPHAEVAQSNGVSLQMYAHPQGLDSAQVGINFVLSLEQPCLNHHKTLSPEILITGSIGNGHYAMLSSPIMARSPSFSLNPFHLGFPSGAQWTVPSTELEALLNFSQDLGLVEEITPVQVWQVIRKHSKFNSLSFVHLERLRQTLLPMVECVGFGAIIQRFRFEQAMDESFSSF